MVSTATLAVVNLSLMMASKWSMAFLFFLGMIVFAAVKRRNRESCSTSLLASSGINHEVYLSFRGTNTRKGFTGFLHRGLEKAGIEVFKDDKNLHGGEEIEQGLKDAIKRSRISIVIFSKDYASSKSCLMELVKMWECRKSHGQIIIPIFYDVSPDDVKHQTGDFATSFKKHEDDKVNPKTIKTCKKVLRQIVDLVGYERKEINGGHETDLVEKVVTRVRQVLKKDDQLVTEDLVGVDLHVQRMMTKLGVVYSDGQAKKVCGQDRRVVAICGMPGVGKTTLAKVVFNKMHKLFDGCSFLEDINSKGVEDFQEMLIADLKKEKIEPLGSSDKAKYTVKPMGNDHALELFRKHAFPVDAPPNVPEYDSLSRDIVEALGGLPMAIVLWAKNLKRKKEIESWRGIRNYLQDCPSEKKVEDAFKASYDSLDKRTKEIFLDIASFFIGNDQKIPCYMWEACGFHPPREVEDLCDMHLLEIGKHNELRMHNLLRHFGRELVKDKGQLQRCRFWNPRESLPTPNNVEGTLSVKGIGLTVEMGCTDSFNCKEFCKMSNLWYLRLDRAKIQGNTKDLPPNLRWLDWRGCRSIPELCDLHLKELVILDLSESKVTKNSEFWEQIAKKVEKLKVLNLQGCVKLHASFKFPAPTNLEILILEDCTELSEIGPFIKKLKKLSSLNLRNCRLVKQLPQELHGMENLTELLIDGTGIHQIVCQEGSLKSLKILSARGCKNLRFISTIGCLTELQSLALDGAKFNWHPKFVFPQNLQSFFKELSDVQRTSNFHREAGAVGDNGPFRH
ncbi:disease resistance protein RPV1 isoform X2 [Eucalyptus grandis]|uniref:disease resistance protein RPV1 isoform X2 n=1 Tax=Eucalyptus grandis TaxID=71139 RepID=UPI00192EEBAC|nr:disease resistance protein RPV1 isoform X2 [Eucalyptus grandis]